MANESDTPAGTNSPEVADGLRARDPHVAAEFLRTWAGAVERYCRTVCAPDLVSDAVEVALADFLDKVDTHPISDEHLEQALLRSTRLTAAEAARIDWDTPGAPEEAGRASFACELTPLYMAGSPKAPASVGAITQMDEHVLSCPRCQAGARRFSAAEDGFRRATRRKTTPELLDALLERLSISREPEPESSPGETIADFRMVTVVREDPEGERFCTALDEQGQRVALRLVPADRDADFRARFLRDGRLLAGLSHPSLPSVRAVGEATEGAYVVCDELHSRTLISVRERGLPDRQAIQLLGEVAEALDSAHSVGLLHKRVRSANFVVGQWLVLRPLLVNFALGREVVEEKEQAPYLSPELLRGEAAGPASDRYAFACTVYELLAGAPPFGDSTGRAARRRRAEGAATVGSGMPSALDAALARGLAEDSDQRPGTAAELMAEVGRALLERGGAPDESPERSEEEQGTHPKAPVIEPKIEPEPVKPEPEAVEPEPEAVEPEPEAVEREPEAVEPELEPVERELEAVEPELEAVEPEPEAVVAERTAVAHEARSAGTQAGEPPGGAAKRLSVKQVAVAAAVAAAVAVALVLVVAGSSDDGGKESPGSPSRTASTGARPRPAATARRSGILPVPLAGAKAVDFDPNGGNGEQPNLVGRAIDGNPATAWQTELYPTGTFGNGVGMYVALPRAQRVRAVDIRTSTPGWDAEIYGSSNGPPAALPAPGWTRLAARARMRASERIALPAPARPIRFCLIWIKKLPPQSLVSINEIRLLADR